MSDISTVWVPAQGRGDWVLKPTVLSRQLINVTSPTAFGNPDGVVTQFALLSGSGNIDSLVASIFRNDARGNNQLYANVPTLAPGLYPQYATNNAICVRASTATFIGSNGLLQSAAANVPRFAYDPVTLAVQGLLIEAASTNLLPSSENFGTWTRFGSGVTVTVDATTAPDGNTTADKLVESVGTAGGNGHQCSETVPAIANATYIQSCFFKAGERTSAQMWDFGGATSTSSAFFNLLTGVATGTGSPSMTAVGGGWWRCQKSVTTSNTATSLTCAVGPSDGSVVQSYNGDGVSGVYAWGAQLELASVASTAPSSYIPTGAAAVTRAADQISISDYSLSAAGLATLAVPPAAGAVLTWTGSYGLNTVSPGGFLQAGNDLETAVLISIFTDRIANPDDEIPDGSNDPRGWWADAGEQYPIGSRLWLLERAKETADTASRAHDYIVEALQWLIDDGAVARFDVSTQWIGPGQLGATVTAYRQDGSTVAMNFASLWQGI